MTRYSRYASPSATRAVLDDFGINLKKAFGQNFLINDAVIGKILSLADVQDTDSVLEVGPGIGTLTDALLAHVHHVTSIEKDPTLPAVLRETLSSHAHAFTLIEKDALKVTLEDIGNAAPNKFIANLPYAVAATVVLDYFQKFSSIQSATVMVQKEVAERMAAAPGTKNYGAYTVKLALVAKPSGQFSVSRNDFMPPPHVDSTVIRLDRKGAEDFPEWVTGHVSAAAQLMAEAAFSSRRKTLANSCKNFFQGRGEGGRLIAAHLTDIFASAGIDGSRRGETLTCFQYLELGKSLTQFLQQTTQ